MGGAFLGAFGAGLSNTLQQAQQRQAEQEYKKALVEQSKLATKKLENDLKLKEYGMQAVNAMYQNQPLPPMPQLATMQPTQEQPRQSLLGRIINPQPPTPAAPIPAAQTAPQPVPQMIAQGQMQGQMPAGTGPSMSPEMGKALAKDIMMKQVFDLPPWQARFQAEQEAKKGEVGTKVTVMTPQGPATIVLNKVGGQMQAYMQPPEYTNIPMTGRGGEPYLISQPKNFPLGTGPTGYGGGGGGQFGGVGGGPMGFQTGPAPTDLPKDIPSETRTKISEINNVINSLTVLQRTVKPEYLGLWGLGGQKWDEYSGIVGGGDPERAAFHRTFNQMKRTEIKQSAGSAVSKQELGFVEAALPKLTMNTEVFNSAAGAIKMLLAMSAYEHASQAGGPSSQVYANTAQQIYKTYMADVKPRIEKALQGDANAFQGYQTPSLPSLPNINQQGGLSARPQLPSQTMTPANIEAEYQRALKQRPDLASQLKARRDQLLQQVR